MLVARFTSFDTCGDDGSSVKFVFRVCEEAYTGGARGALGRKDPAEPRSWRLGGVKNSTPCGSARPTRGANAGCEMCRESGRRAAPRRIVPAGRGAQTAACAETSGELWATSANEEDSPASRTSIDKPARSLVRIPLLSHVPARPKPPASCLISPSEP